MQNIFNEAFYIHMMLCPSPQFFCFLLLITKLREHRDLIAENKYIHNSHLYIIETL